MTARACSLSCSSLLALVSGDSSALTTRACSLSCSSLLALVSGDSSALTTRACSLSCSSLLAFAYGDSSACSLSRVLACLPLPMGTLVHALSFVLVYLL